MIPPFFGPTEVAQDWSGGNSSTAAVLSWRVAYINNLSIPVVVRWRSGLKFTIPPDYKRYTNRFVVRVEITLLPTIKSDMVRLLSVLDPVLTAEHKALREALIGKISQAGGTIHLDYPLTAEQLKEMGGSLYYHELDTLISLERWDNVPEHPFSVLGRYEQLVQAQAQELSKPGFAYGVDLVDNTGRWGDRYMNIAGKVYKIPARKDLSRADGFYVVGNAPVQNELSPTPAQVRHYDVEGCEAALGIYKSAEEALNLGDMTLQRREQLAELEHQVVLGKAELQKTKASYELAVAGKDKEIKDLQAKAEQDKLELEKQKTREEQERARIKDYYEGRSYDRKDSTELFKALPAFIIGIGAAVAAMKALA